MTPDQIFLVRSTWPLAAEVPDSLTSCFYEHLFEIDSDAARLFAHVDMPSQRKKLAQSLAVVVHAIDDPDRLLPALAALGKRHAQYGIEDRHFDSVGAALLRALGDALGEAFTPDVRGAWTEAYTIVASVMRRALGRDLAAAS